jgi:C1A family cysteine protease
LFSWNFPARILTYSSLPVLFYFDLNQDYETSKKTMRFYLIVGWDDLKGAWLIKNSFGKDWGEEG